MNLVVRTLSEQIFNLVRDRIVSGAVEAERPIRQDALAAELGVSKIPLREALARLEQEGLLVSQANRGFFVRPLSVAEAEEVFALRLKLEPDLVAEAALVADDQAREAAVRALEALDVAHEEAPERAGALNRDFHLSLVRPSAKPVAAQFVERLHTLSERYASKHLEPPGREDRASREHHMILAAWTARNGIEVAELTRVHIAMTLDDLRRQFAVERQP